MTKFEYKAARQESRKLFRKYGGSMPSMDRGLTYTGLVQTCQPRTFFIFVERANAQRPDPFATFF